MQRWLHNTQIKGSFCGLNVINHNHSTLGVFQMLQCVNITHSYAATFIGAYMLYQKTNVYKMCYLSI